VFDIFIYSIQVRIRFYWYDVFKQKSASTFSNCPRRQHENTTNQLPNTNNQFYQRTASLIRSSIAGHYSISFEKVNVLFNVAAFMSQIALQQNRALDESIKICAKYFQVITLSYAQSHL
jgi:hypothetical protein